MGSLMHPDAELLAVCAQLRIMEAEWQRLWLYGTQEELMAYSSNVWPCTGFLRPFDDPDPPSDLPGQLLKLEASTAEGVQAKAACIAAMEDVYTYTDSRNDAYELSHNLLVEAAGPRRRLMADEAAPAGSGKPSVREREQAEGWR